MVIEFGNDIVNKLVSKIKAKNLTKKSIQQLRLINRVLKIWLIQKSDILKIIKPETKVLANIKIRYSNTFNNFTLTQFSGLIYILKVNHDDS